MKHVYESTIANTTSLCKNSLDFSLGGNTHEEERASLGDDSNIMLNRLAKMLLLECWQVWGSG
jgi:hypothetical protein